MQKPGENVRQRSFDMRNGNGSLYHERDRESKALEHERLPLYREFIRRKDSHFQKIIEVRVFFP